MKSFSQPLDFLIRFTGRTIILLAFLVSSIPASASEPTEDTPRPFGGNFAEFSLRGGPVLAEHTKSWSIDVGFRNSIPFYLTDNRISYRYRQLDHQVGTAIHGIHGTFGIHPFYLTLLSGSLVGHFLASLHLELGLGAHLGQHLLNQSPRHRPGFAWSLGSGFDLPITDPNRSYGLWLNVNYRRTWTTLTAQTQGELLPLHDHGFHIGLGWRINGGFW